MSNDNEVKRARYQIWIKEVTNEKLLNEMAISDYPAIARDELKLRIKTKTVVEWIQAGIFHIGEQRETRTEPTKERIDSPERVEGISYDRYTKHAPWWWLDKMKDSDWVKAGLPGVNSRIEDAKLTIEGKDAIKNSPPMCDCTWQELNDSGRAGFLIVMVRSFNQFNEKYEYLRR